jgi:ferric-dicitrate binding protein FerR (iron transport regulator)
VWLNSKSKLSYPAQFSGDDRVVELSGEAYFDVAREPKPFIVKAGEMSVVVMGTRFDVMAYPDEDSIRTTLIDGKVRVQNETRKVELKPGEQIVVARGSVELPAPRVVNWLHVVEWKNNVFYFPPHASLRNVLKQIARWYDLQPEFHGHIPDQEEEYGGTIRRTLPLKDVLEELRLPGVRFTVIGRRLIVEPDNSN